MSRPWSVVVSLALILLVSLTAARAAEGEVPTSTDSVACNEEAPVTTRTGMTAPTMGDHARADGARAGAMTTRSVAFTGVIIESPDPQIHGMDAEGAKDPTYQAAYRGCMRRKGF